MIKVDIALPGENLTSKLYGGNLTKIKRAHIILNRSQPGLPQSTGSASPVFGRIPNIGLKSLRMVLT